MRFSFDPHKNRLAAAALLGASVLTASGAASALPASAVSSSSSSFSFSSPDTGSAPETGSETILLNGSTKASYFWDDSSGRAGDTGLPASGKPMQKGMIASPSWPLLTEGYVTYKGKKAKFFVGDRGPGVPSGNGVMLDLDAKTFADLTGGTFNSNTLMVNGNGGLGHIEIDYVITKWGDGVGKKNHPVAFSTGAWGHEDNNPATPPESVAVKAEEPKKAEEPQKVEAAPGIAPNAAAPMVAKVDTKILSAAVNSASTSPVESSSGAALGLTGLFVAGGAAYLVAGRLRKKVDAKS